LFFRTRYCRGGNACGGHYHGNDLMRRPCVKYSNIMLTTRLPLRNIISPAIGTRYRSAMLFRRNTARDNTTRSSQRGIGTASGFRRMALIRADNEGVLEVEWEASPSAVARSRAHALLSQRYYLRIGAEWFKFAHLQQPPKYKHEHYKPLTSCRLQPGGRNFSPSSTLMV